MLRSLDRLARIERKLARLVPDEPGAVDTSPEEIPGLLDFVNTVSVKFETPAHLAPIADLFERAARGEPVRACISLPPRHGKTELLLHSLAWRLRKDPATRLAYASAVARLAHKKSARARTLTERAGVRLANDSRSKSDWRTTCEDGGLWAVGAGGQINGEGFDLVLVDDPHKGRAEAESPIIRDRIHSWLKADCLPRLEPSGSVIVCHTRWHQDDLIGRLAQEGWELVTLPAISKKGEALWPTRWPLARLLRIQEELGGPNGYDWVSLYQGSPQPSGLALFQGVHTYDKLPPRSALRVSIGVDFGYSKSRGDYSTALVLGESNGVYYVMDVQRLQVEPRVFRDRVLALCQQYETRTVASYIAATERGGLEFLREGQLHVQEYRSPGKLTQALSVSAAWNTGKVLTPNPESPDLEKPAWLDRFLSEVRGFTGMGERHDDQVDALGGAFEVIKLHSIDWNFIDDLRSAVPRPFELS